MKLLSRLDLWELFEGLTIAHRAQSLQAAGQLNSS